MHAGGMLSYTRTPICVNGMFGVAKEGDTTRLIIDCRPVNALLVPSPHVALPTPDIIARFDVPSEQPLFAAKVDLSDYYHRIKMPPSWHPYFALPPVLAGDIGDLTGFANDQLVWPCITTLPMGFSHAVYLAQAAHEHLIDTRVPLLSANDRLRHMLMLFPYRGCSVVFPYHAMMMMVPLIPYQLIIILIVCVIASI
jgi:hypothetical protein